MPIVVSEGERSKQIEVWVVPEKPKATPAPPPANEPAQESWRRPTAYVLFGVGALGLAGFGYFGLRGRSQEADLEDCRPCSDERVSDVSKTYLAADISLGVGLLSLGVGAYLFLTPTEAPGGTRLAIATTYAPSGVGSLSVVGEF